MVPFPFYVQLITFFFKYFFYSKFFLICVLQFFFIKTSSNFFPIQVTNNISPRNGISNFTNNKIFFLPIYSIYFSKNVFILSNSNVVTSFKFGIFFIKIYIVFSTESPITSIGFILIILWTVLLYLLTISSNTSK